MVNRPYASKVHGLLSKTIRWGRVGVAYQIYEGMDGGVIYALRKNIT